MKINKKCEILTKLKTHLKYFFYSNYLFFSSCVILSFSLNKNSKKIINKKLFAYMIKINMPELF